MWMSAKRSLADRPSEAAAARGGADELEQKITWLQETLCRADLRNGLTKEENAVLWRTADIGLAVALVSKGLRVVSLD
jgi:hypothetical protein